MTVTDIISAFNPRAYGISIIPLAIFRICFGILMAFSIARNWYYNWIQELYINPDFHFTYHFFSWVEPLPGNGMQLTFLCLFILAVFIALGLFWRLSSILFFILFCYTELIDKTLYLNHYYFISFISFTLILTPAGKFWSLDNLFFKHNPKYKIHPCSIVILRLQIALVYFFAGIAKINYDWLYKALPLKIWLPAKSNLPIIGDFLAYEWTPYLMSYGGVIYDLSIPFLLLFRKTRPFAFVLVIVFHLLTWYLFQIGMFPWIMIFSAVIFFDEIDYLKLSLLLKFSFLKNSFKTSYPRKLNTSKYLIIFMALFLSLQIIIPLRKNFYCGNDTWHEANYRYSWNVMLVEKTGSVEFTCFNPKTQRKWTVYPNDYLTTFQNKQMSFQPDMILEFANYLDSEHIDDIVVTASAYVSINGRFSKPFIDINTDLTKFQSCAFCVQPWILSD